MGVESIIKTIQYVLAPAVMVSSTALLLLGLQNKFSNLANRFRGLNSDRRKLRDVASPSPEEMIRLQSLNAQIKTLLKRANYVQNAILACDFSIACFMISSILIFFRAFMEKAVWFFDIAVFLLGLFLILIAIANMILETQLAYHIIQLEEKT